MEEISFEEIFLKESKEYLQDLNNCILKLEKDLENKEIVDEMFRIVHNLKGMAGTMGYENMTELTHTMENIFELIRNDEIDVDLEIINLLFEALDELEKMLDYIRGDLDIEYDISELIDKLNAIDKSEEEIKTRKEEKYKAPVRREEDQYKFMINIARDCSFKGARAFLIVQDMEKYGRLVSTNPEMKELEEGKFDDYFEVILETKELAEIRLLIEETPEIKNLDIEKYESNVKEEVEEIKDREEVEKTKDREEANNEKKIEDLSENEETKEDKKPIKENGPKKELEKEIKISINTRSEYISVNIDKLDELMDLVSSLVTERNSLEELNREHKIEDMNRPIGEISSITSKLQSLLMDIRMQPIKVVLNRYPRMVRDLALELDKDVELIIEGEDTELDRNIVAEIGEPLVHIIRNAVDHGIESREDRLKKGKKEEGTIRINTCQEGNKVVITIEDDGKGIDPAEIKESANEKGIKTEGLEDEELLDLIFDSGLSTASKVTDVSGRGFGMNIVQEKISNLGGEIRVESKLNVGTRFIIHLPLRLSVMEVMVTDIGNKKFALPLDLIDRIIYFEEDKIKKSYGNEMYMYEDKLIPLIRLSKELDLEGSDEDYIIIVNLGQKEYGLVVSGFLGRKEIVVKEVPSILDKLPQYLGTGILGDGSIVLVLDLGKIIEARIDS